MQTIPTAAIPDTELDQLESYVRGSGSHELRDAVLLLIRGARAGNEIVTFGPNDTLTPSEAAERLGMSRTHLYKILDRGELAFHNVGRDRRIFVRDLIAFEETRQSARRELAERFAQPQKTRNALIAELIDES